MSQKKEITTEKITKASKEFNFLNKFTDCSNIFLNDSLATKMKSLNSFNNLGLKFLKKNLEKPEKMNKQKFIKHPAFAIFDCKSTSIPKYSNIEAENPKARVNPPDDETFDQCLYKSKISKSNFSSFKLNSEGKNLMKNSGNKVEEKIRFHRLGLENIQNKDTKRLLSVGWQQDEKKKELLEKRLTPILISQSSISNDILSDFERSLLQKSERRNSRKSVAFEI